MKEHLKIIEILLSMRNDKNIAGMERFGIKSQKLLGISMKDLDSISKEIGKNHSLALDLWNTRYHEARLLASMIAVPKQSTIKELHTWVHDFDNWAVCDSVCGKYIRKTEHVYDLIYEWEQSKFLYVKRAAFACMAWIAVHNKKLTNEYFDKYFDLIFKNVLDERHYIAKAVNWALRQIGKRNAILNERALDLSQSIITKNPQNKTALWIAKDALRELEKKSF